MQVLCFLVSITYKQTCPGTCMCTHKHAFTHRCIYIEVVAQLIATFALKKQICSWRFQLNQFFGQSNHLCKRSNGNHFISHDYYNIWVFKGIVGLFQKLSISISSFSLLQFYSIFHVKKNVYWGKFCGGGALVAVSMCFLGIQQHCTFDDVLDTYIK